MSPAEILAAAERRVLRLPGRGVDIALLDWGGDGPLALLHHANGFCKGVWGLVAEGLRRDFRVVAMDARGHGDSSKPKGLPDHSNYAKRAMALDMVEAMEALGYRRFHLVGHDRGGRVGHRLARDHGDRVHTFAALDISPTLKMFESTDLAFATAYYHWFMMLQPPPLPERMLAGQVPFNILGRVGRDKPDLSKFDRAAVREYVRCFKDPRAIHGSCEDYRAAGTIDLEHDRADRDAGRKLAMPVLALWGRQGVVGRLFDCLADWREVADDVTGRALNCGHFIPEEAAPQALAEIRRFLKAHPMPAVDGASPAPARRRKPAAPSARGRAASHS